MNQIPVELSDSIARAGRIAFGEPWQAETCVAAPGRIEVIGNHVDYNGGPVLAAAIDRHVAIGVASNTDSRAIRVVFTEVGDSKPQRVALPVPVDWRSDRREPQPIDYLFGAIAALLHADLGNGVPADEIRLQRWLPEIVVQLVRPGAFVVTSTELHHPSLESQALPPGVAPGRYFMYRRD